MNANDEWADRGAVALKAGAYLSVLALVAVIATHGPMIADEASIEAAAAADTPVTSAPAATDTRPYYFPSEYTLNAPDTDEAAPTF